MQITNSRYNELLRLFRQATRETSLPHFADHWLLMDKWLQDLDRRGLAVYRLTRMLWLADGGGYETTDWNSVGRITSAGYWSFDPYRWYDYEYPEDVTYFIGPKDLM